MRRALIGTGLVALLPLAAVAVGSVKHYHGPVDQGGSVKFNTKVRHGKVKSVKSFVFSKVDMTCDPPFGTRPIGNGAFPVPSMRVRHRKFHGDFSQFGGHGHIRGKFADHFRKADGTLRVNGDPAGLHNCDTGIDDWHAEKTG
jgi:hypothetical protein